METTTETPEPTLTPITNTERLIMEGVIVSIVIGTVTVFGLAAYGAISLTQDVTGYFKRRFGKVTNISSL